MKFERLLILPDVHAPWHCKKSFDLVCKVGKAVKFDRLITMGDFADCADISFHERDLDNRLSFADEMLEVNKCLDRLDALGIPKKTYIMGNHEVRLDRYLAGKAPALARLPGMTMRDQLRLDKRGWQYVPYRQDVKIGKLYLTHDEGAAGPLAAMTARSTYGTNIVIGHCHSMTTVYTGNAQGETFGGHSFGWLGSAPSAKYLPQVKARKWTLGFGVALLEPNGNVHITACPIIKGKVAVFGQLYS